MKRVYHANDKQKKLKSTTILILDQADFEAKNITENKEEYVIMIKESTEENNKTILNVYVPHNTTWKRVKKNSAELKKFKSTVIVDFNIQ